MLKNNNTEVIKRMAKRSLCGNRRRSATMILAIVLSSFLLFSIFTVGATYLEMSRIQRIRLNGADFDAIMYGGTEEQLQICMQDASVEKIGVLALAGYVEETAYDKTPNVALAYADEIYWQDMMKEATESVKGTYPNAEDEILVSEEALEKCGFQNVDVGDSITFLYGLKGQNSEKTFRISGVWKGYGNQEMFFISEAFYKQTGLTYADVSSGRIQMIFAKRWMSEEEQQAFIDRMNLGKAQNLFFVAEYGNAAEIFAGLAGIAFVTCLCAYLLIYNIMYLAVAGNIRYYGLLQTVGMTGRQIHRLMHRQMLWIGGIGITGGICLGAGVSFGLIPVVVRSMGIRRGQIEKITVSFHPLIFLGVILLTGLTVFIAGRKSTKIAAASSPVEALGYQMAAGAKKSRKMGRGKVVRRLAWEQLLKDKKKTAVVMLSLAASLSVFLCMTTILRSKAAREYYYHYMNVDMTLKNDTLTKENPEEHRQIFDEARLETWRNMSGVKEVLPVIFTQITVPWEPDVADFWMREFYETWMYIPYEDEVEEYKQYPENFGSSLVGITETDFRALNEELKTPVDEDAFLSGKTCILYRDRIQSITDEDLKGKQITCAQYGNGENTRTFEIAGLTDISEYTALAGYPPTIIVSDQVVKAFVEEPMVYKVEFFYEKEYSEETERAVLSVLEESPDARDYSCESKIETLKNAKKAQGHMEEIGVGIVLILAFIGIMNYVNTSVGSVQSRMKTLSVLESVGMTERQMQKMFVTEGLMYTAGAWLLTLTVGLGVTYYLYQSVNYYGAAFRVPLIPLLLTAVLTIAVCVSVPVIVYRRIGKQGSLVERMKGIE